jgi:hypothetical protein
MKEIMENALNNKDSREKISTHEFLPDSDTFDPWGGDK